MSDDYSGLASHVGGATGAAGLVAMVMRWFQSQEQRKVETTLALLVQKVDGISESQKKHDGFGERLALAEQKVDASHRRTDEVVERVERLESELPRRKR